MPHPNFSDEVNRNIAQSEIEGGVYLDRLCEGAVLEVETQHHGYTIVIRGRGRDLISGHPKYCPDPVPVRIEGSTWGGSMLKTPFPDSKCSDPSGVQVTWTYSRNRKRDLGGTTGAHGKGQVLIFRQQAHRGTTSCHSRSSWRGLARQGEEIQSESREVSSVTASAARAPNAQGPLPTNGCASY
jgi:hypothetical protein